MVIWMVLVFSQALVPNLAQDETPTAPAGTCNTALGLASGSIPDDRITSTTEEETGSFGGRLRNEEGAWCFKNDSIAAQNALLTIDLEDQRFVSGFASQGPPPSLQPNTYNHVVGYSAAYSRDAKEWLELNGGDLIFDTDTNDTSDTIKYFPIRTIVLTRYVKINVTMQVSASETICLRFELYGCNTDVQPMTSMQAITTPKGKIEVSWRNPTADTTLEFDSPSGGMFVPSGYVVLYRPKGVQSFVPVTTEDMSLSLEDVRLGATYFIQLQCLLKDVSIKCGSAQIEAYPPCPSDWTGGNEYHCFLYLTDVSSFEDAKSSCLEMDVDGKLGDLSYLVDEEEEHFLSSRILPEDVSKLWLVGNACQENDDCCKLLEKKDGALIRSDCGEEELNSAVCIKDHKGEGSRIRISSVKASSEGTSASVTWRYEGIGWKTDKLQAKLWTASSGEDNPTVLSFSTLDEVFSIKDLAPGTMYSVLLRPAPNIRTEELTYQFIIIEFPGEDGDFGALLTPIRMSVYVIWSGTLKITWDEALTNSESGGTKASSKYSISHLMEATDANTKENIVESGQEFFLTPVTMQVAYTFHLGCFFAGKFHPCGMASVRTDPPDHIDRDPSGLFTMYEVISDTDRNWFEAEEDCQHRSGHLTSLMNEAEGKTLLNIFPTKDARLWTGAKLRRNGTSYWTDGNSMPYLPMGRNSGVSGLMDSCCRALNKAGRLNLLGGKCSDTLPHICKYRFRDILAPPSSLSTVSQKWNSLEMSWNDPEEGWLPTFYSVKVCKKDVATGCSDYKDLKDRLSFVAEDLSEFTAYDVTVQGDLKPIDVTTSAKLTVYTYPKSPVRMIISPDGKMSVETPMLVAMGSEDAKVIVVLYKGDEEVMTASGDVKRVELDNLVPEESYELLVKDQGTDWESRLSFSAVPTCPSSDVGAGDWCIRLTKNQQSFEAAKSDCADMKIPEAVGTVSMWSPEPTDDLQDLAQRLGSNLDFWLENPAKEEAANDEECSEKDGTNQCSRYDAAKKMVISSYCCDPLLSAICAYKMRANLRQVTDLLPSFIGNNTLQILWAKPPEVSWNIQRYHVQWRSMEMENSPLEAKIVEGSTEVLLEGLEYGTEYEVIVTPLGAKNLRGESEKLLVSTLDPRQQLTINVLPNGATTISSGILTSKGRGEQEVDVAVLQRDPETQKRRTARVVRGKAQGVEITGLEPGAEYLVEMTPVDGKPFNYSGSFTALPSCGKDQIQEGLVCVWAAAEARTSKDAAQVCRDNSGELLDYKTQKELSPAAKAMLASHVKTHFWMDLSDSSTSAALVDGTSDECAGVKDTDIMCCTFEVTEEGELDDLKCTCCSEERPFACKTEAKVDMGEIGKITIEDITERSLTLGWSLESDANWQQPSFLVTWEPTDRRRQKRSVDNQFVVKDSGVTIDGLKPGTSYQVAVAPYSDTTQIGGSSKEIVITTKEEIAAAGLVKEGCTVTILKIICCVIVIIGSIFTVFVLIATRMLYMDCLAQIFSEIGILGAYLCILVSSAQSYSVDNKCVRANPTLCVAVSALIQFFFQSTFLFMLLESLILYAVLKDYLPACCTPRSPLALMITGFGIPAIMNIVLAAIASNEFSDGNDNCWLYLDGRAVLPSVIPVLLFACLSLFLLLSVFDADEPRGNLTPTRAFRGRVYLKTRWACFAILTLVSVSYATGLFAANDRNPTLHYVFAGFSIALGILMPLLRIRCDDHVKAQLKRGLFAGLRDDIGGIRVTPAPDGYEPNPLLKMAEFNSPKYKQKELENLAIKNRDSLMDSDAVWHR